MPRGLSAEAKKFWEEEVPGLIKLDLATDLDSKALAIMAELWAIFWKAKRDDQVSRALSALSQLRQQMAKFGMTPADRAGLSVGKTSAGNAMDRYAG